VLLARDSEGALEIRLCFRSIRITEHQRDFPGDTIYLGFKPSFHGCFNRRHRFSSGGLWDLTGKPWIVFAPLLVCSVTLTMLAAIVVRYRPAASMVPGR
jgi:hypothetical protein